MKNCLECQFMKIEDAYADGKVFCRCWHPKDIKHNGWILDRPQLRKLILKITAPAWCMEIKNEEDEETHIRRSDL